LVAEGIGEHEFAQRFGKRLSETFPNEISRLLRKGLVEWIETDQRRLRLTRFGQLLGNQAFLEFV
jgi:coproporphyrinogen III oxidase-like Fe-S oxidoreductase